VAATVPGISGLLAGASAEAPAVAGTATDAETVAADVSGPLVAHVTDAAAGKVSIYIGESQVTFHDPVLVEHLLRRVGP
jgi:hypothetical protein